MHNKLKEIYKVKLDQISKIDLDIMPERIADFVDFKAMIEKKKNLSLIAEIKKASPSRGLIRQNFDINEIVSAYNRMDLQAISVLTDQQFFQGSIDYLKEVKNNTTVPVLRKDFIIDQKQVYESFHIGADMILLIVALLDTKKLAELFSTAKDLGLNVLVETHTSDEIKKAVDIGAEIIGINNRDLNTFKVDLNTALNLVSEIPDSVIKVAESGMHSAEDIQQIEQAGFDAVLIGEALMQNNDIVASYRKLFPS